VAAVIYLDTHVVAWLYAGELELFPKPVRILLDRETLLISPMVELELQYLYEINRTSERGDVVVETLEREIGISRCQAPFTQVVAGAMRESWTRDPFDRLIVAQARLRRTPLLTKDDQICAHYEEALWLG